MHVAVGAIVGRWWIALLPLAWAVLSLGAFQSGGEIEDSVGLFVVSTVPFIWVPALLAGVAVRKLADPRWRTWPHVVGVAVGLLLVLAFQFWPSHSSQEDPSTRPRASSATIDEKAGTYGGAGLGSSADDVEDAHGPNTVRGSKAGIPRDADVAFVDAPFGGRTIWGYCYDDACFFFYDPGAILDSSPSLNAVPPDATVSQIDIASPGAATLRGIEVGDPIADVADAYPELTCGSETYDDYGPFERCTGQVAEDRWIWFGGDPVNVISLGSVPLE